MNSSMINVNNLNVIVPNDHAILSWHSNICHLNASLIAFILYNWADISKQKDRLKMINTILNSTRNIHEVNILRNEIWIDNHLQSNRYDESKAGTYTGTYPFVTRSFYDSLIQFDNARGSFKGLFNTGEQLEIWIGTGDRKYNVDIQEEMQAFINADAIIPRRRLDKSRRRMGLTPKVIWFTYSITSLENNRPYQINVPITLEHNGSTYFLAGFIQASRDHFRFVLSVNDYSKNHLAEFIQNQQLENGQYRYDALNREAQKKLHGRRCNEIHMFEQDLRWVTKHILYAQVTTDADSSNLNADANNNFSNMNDNAFENHLQSILKQKHENNDVESKHRKLDMLCQKNIDDFVNDKKNIEEKINDCHSDSNSEMKWFNGGSMKDKLSKLMKDSDCTWCSDHITRGNNDEYLMKDNDNNFVAAIKNFRSQLDTHIRCHHVNSFIVDFDNVDNIDRPAVHVFRDEDGAFKCPVCKKNLDKNFTSARRVISPITSSRHT